MNTSDFRGAIWPNRDKEKETHPDFKGNATIDGVEYWVSAWRKKEGAGDKHPSLTFSFKKKDSVAKQGIDETKAVLNQAPPTIPDDSDIPF